MIRNLVLVGAFFTVVLLVLAIYNISFSPRRNTLSRMKQYTDPESMTRGTWKLENMSMKEHFIAISGVLGNIFPKRSYMNKKKKKLIEAAVLIKPEEFIGISLISALGLGGVIFLVTKTIVAIAFVPIGFIIPDLVIGMKKSKRMARLNSQLPDALNIISNGLRVGFTFNQAMTIVTKEVAGPISDEFNKVLRDNSLGIPFEEALINMSDRTDDEDLDMFVTALIIQRQVGGNIAEVLDSISHTIRERVRLKGEVKTLTAQGRISAVIVSLLPIALALAFSVMSPGYLDVLFTTFIGKAMLIVGALLQLMGMFILTKLVNVKV